MGVNGGMKLYTQHMHKAYHWMRGTTRNAAVFVACLCTVVYATYGVSPTSQHEQTIDFAAKYVTTQRWLHWQVVGGSHSYHPLCVGRCGTFFLSCHSSMVNRTYHVG